MEIRTIIHNTLFEQLPVLTNKLQEQGYGVQSVQMEYGSIHLELTKNDIKYSVDLDTNIDSETTIK